MGNGICICEQDPELWHTVIVGAGFRNATIPVEMGNTVREMQFRALSAGTLHECQVGNICSEFFLGSSLRQAQTSCFDLSCFFFFFLSFRDEKGISFLRSLLRITACVPLFSLYTSQRTGGLWVCFSSHCGCLHRVIRPPSEDF